MKTITLIVPDNITDISFGGDNYEVKNNRVIVPVAAAEHLYQFGLTNAPTEEKKVTAKGKKEEAE